MRRLRAWVPDTVSPLSWIVAGRDDAEALLAAAADAAAAAFDLQPRTHAVDGDPADAMIAVAEDAGRRSDRRRQQGRRRVQARAARTLQRADRADRLARQARFWSQLKPRTAKTSPKTLHTAMTASAPQDCRAAGDERVRQAR